MNKGNVKSFFKKLGATIASPWKAFQRKAPLASFITGRIITMIFILFFLGFALFGLMELAPGDIVDQMMTQQIMSSSDSKIKTNGSLNSTEVTGAQMEALREELGLNDPFYVQYFKWLNRVLIHHDLGVSLISRAPVSFLIKSRLWNSLLLNFIFNKILSLLLSNS